MVNFVTSKFVKYRIKYLKAAVAAVCACVVWLCDPTWQVTLRTSEMGFP